MEKLDVFVDRTCSGGATGGGGKAGAPLYEGANAPSSWVGGGVDMPPLGVSAAAARCSVGGDDSSAGIPACQRIGDDDREMGSLSLDVWVDASVVEAFAMGGRGRVTTRVYPLDEAVAWGVDVFGRCVLSDELSSVGVWELGNAWVEDV